MKINKVRDLGLLIYLQPCREQLNFVLVHTAYIKYLLSILFSSNTNIKHIHLYISAQHNVKLETFTNLTYSMCAVYILKYQH